MSPGSILVRQRPGSAKGVVFVTLEDETGIANAILWPDRFEAQRRTVMSAAMLGDQRAACRRESGIVSTRRRPHHRFDRAAAPDRRSRPAAHDHARRRRDAWRHDRPRDRKPAGNAEATRAGNLAAARRQTAGWDLIPIKSHDFH